MAIFNFCKYHFSFLSPADGHFSSVQLLSHVWLFVTPWIAAHQASLSITDSRVYPNPCPSSQWCHPAISSSVVPFSSCPQSVLALGSFPVNQLFAWGGQSIGVSASPSVPPMNTQDWSPLGWTGWISFQPKRLKSLLQHHNSKASILRAQLSSPSNSLIHTWPLEKTIALTRRTFIGKVMFLLFNMLSRLVITFLPRSKHF